MKVIFEKMQDQVFAMNPVYLPKTGQIKMDYKGITHMLIITAPLGTALDIQAEETKMLLRALENRVLREEQVLEETQGIRASCVTQMQLNDQRGYISVPVRNTAMEYSVFACRYDKNEDALRIYLPVHPGTRYRTDVMVEIPYEILPYTIIEKKKFRKMKETPTPFVRLTVGSREAPFPDESIIYTIDNDPCEYPLTSAMSGRPFLIRTDGKRLSLRVVSKGITLREKSERGR